MTFPDILIVNLSTSLLYLPPSPLPKEHPFSHFLYPIICILLFLFSLLPPSSVFTSLFVPKQCPFPHIPYQILCTLPFTFTHSPILLDLTLFPSLEVIQFFCFPNQVTCTLIFPLLWLPVLGSLCQLDTAKGIRKQGISIKKMPPQAVGHHIISD